MNGTIELYVRGFILFQLRGFFYFYFPDFFFFETLHFSGSADGGRQRDLHHNPGQGHQHEGEQYFEQFADRYFLFNPWQAVSPVLNF